MEYIPYFVSFLLLLVASVMDICFRKIPNWLTVPAFLLGILVWRAFFFRGNLWASFILVIALVIATLLRLFGGGDMKLLLVIAAWNDWKVVVATIGIGAFVSLVWHFVRDRKDAWERFKKTVRALQLSQMPMPDVNAQPVPFAPFLLIGYTVSLIIFELLKGVTMWC